MPYDLVSPFAPAGDQPRAIRELSAGLARDDRYQTLLGVTGSGKTMTMAHVIAGCGRPTLVLSHNKTLAAQLYGELKSFFPKSAVEFFISYYDYYQPEAYVPQTDTYIAKDSSINDDIDRLRLRATSSLMEREDVVIVASVSAIYGLGDPELYRQRLVTASVGEARGRDALLEALVGVQYQRNDTAFERGTFRVRGDTIEVFPAYDEQAVRVEFWGDTVERIAKIDPLTGNVITELPRAAVYPATHFVTERPTIERAVAAIRAELKERLAELRVQNKLLEAQRLESRTNFDIDMLLEVGRCTGIENYSRPLTGRAPGERPACLLDYFPDDYLCIIDESHQTLPQLAGMYEGDRSRKQTLVDYGFRLPSALDNRPLRIDEFMKLVPRILFVSATPGEEEFKLSGGVVVEQIIRGLRLGEFDVLVGINLLREGLDLPEVSLVAILDADQEGFLRSDRSLIQTVGRAARNLHGRAILYADRVTGSMQRALDEMNRRRQAQLEYNERNGITPRSIVKSVDQVRFATRFADAKTAKPAEAGFHRPVDAKEREALIRLLESQMQAAAEELDFELAAVLRDQILELRADGDAVRPSHAPLRGRAQPVR